MIAVLPHVAALCLPFQLDDYGILAHLSAFAEGGGLPGVESYFFRPTAWALWILLLEVGGGMAHAPLFHAVTLLLHGVTAWLLYRVLRAAVDPRAAFVGGAAFGLMPGGIQAATWIAAAGDEIGLLLLLCAVLLAQRFARTGRGWTLVALAACVALAFLAKESVVALLPAAALGLWSVPPPARKERRWWMPGIAAALGLAAGVLARWSWLGILGPAYAHDVGLTRWELERFQKPLFQMLAPWNRAPEFEDVAPKTGAWLSAVAGDLHPRLAEPVGVLWLAVLVTLGVPVLLGLLRDARRAGRAILVAIAFAFAFLPALALWRFGDVATNTLSRVFYGPIAVLCAFVAVSIDPLFARRDAPTRVLRRVAAALLAVFALIQIDLAIHVWRTELRVADLIRARLESVEAIARSETPDTHLIAIDPQVGLGGMPLLGAGVSHALERPFSQLGRSVSWWNDVVTLDRAPEFQKHAGPIRILEVTGDRFGPLGDLVPAIPDPMPRLDPVPGEPGRFAFAEPVAARAVAAIRFPLTRVPEGGGSCEWMGEGAASVTGPLLVSAKGNGVMALAIPPRTDERAWRSMPKFRGVAVHGAEVGGAPEVVATLPEIELRMPIAARTIVLGQLPRIQFGAPFDSPEYRFTFDFLVGAVRFPMTYTVPRGRLERAGDGSYAFVPAAGDRVEWPGHTYEVTWIGLPEAFRRELAGSVRAIAVQFRVQGIAGDGVTPESESAWDTLTVLDEEPR